MISNCAFWFLFMAGKLQLALRPAYDGSYWGCSPSVRMNYQLTMWRWVLETPRSTSSPTVSCLQNSGCCVKPALFLGTLNSDEFGGNLIEMIYTPLIMVFQLCLSLGNIPYILRTSKQPKIKESPNQCLHESDVGSRSLLDSRSRKRFTLAEAQAMIYSETWSNRWFSNQQQNSKYYQIFRLFKLIYSETLWIHIEIPSMTSISDFR
jgi:hypothetical protein